MIWLILFIALVVAPFAVERLRKPVDTQARRAAQGKMVDLPDGATHCQWHGRVGGPVAVCVHGLSSSSYIWGAVVQIMVMMGYRVLTYDLYGRGLSDCPKSRQDRAFFQGQLTALLEQEQVPDGFTLMGYSMGGAIAAEFAAHAPGRVDRLILVAPAGLGLTLPRFQRLCRDLPVLGDWAMLVFGWLVQRWAIRRAPGPSAVDGVRDLQRADIARRGYHGAVLSSLRYMLASDSADDHRRIAQAKLPVLSIWGQQDAVIPSTAPGRLAEINREARQVSIAGAGHGVIHTHPRELQAAIQAFLRGD